MTTPSRFDTTFSDANDDDVDIVVWYYAHKGRKGARDCGRYLPIEPDEPAHIEIDWIAGPDGKPLELDTAKENRIKEEIAEYLDAKMDADS